MPREVTEEVAGTTQVRYAVFLTAAFVGGAVALIPSAAAPLLPLPHVSAMYGAATAMINAATFWLLMSAPKRPRSHTVIAAAYLFATLMAVAHVVTFPGAVFPDRPVFGSPHAVSWLFIAWRAGFAAFIAWAVLVAARESRRGSSWSDATSIIVAVVGAAAACMASQFTDAAAVTREGDRQIFSAFSVYGSYASAVLAAVTTALIFRTGLHTRSIFVWLVVVLAAEAAGVWLSTFGGGRYTVSWYATRVEGMVASSIVLVLLGHHFRNLQRKLLAAIDILKARTDELQAEAHRRETAESNLAHAQRMEAVGRLGAGLAHDLNNILQVIAGRLAILRRRLGSAVESDVAVIERNMRRADALTRQLTLVSGKRQITPHRVDTGLALRDAAEGVRQLLGTKYPLHVSIAENLPHAALDVLELEIALTNLVTNARDATPEGGPIEFQAHMELRSSASPQLVMQLRDYGAGIRAELLERIFEPFFTTKEAGKGTGLGLAQVRAFVEASGGKVKVDSVVGGGTTVTLLLPLEKREPPAVVSKSSLDGPTEGQVVLLVDDNQDIREASQHLLMAGGFVVRSASDATEALGLVNGGLVPDILLSDIVMPGSMHGVELARRVRALHPEVRVVLVTGYSDVADDASNEGYAVMRKPYDLARLTEVLAAKVRQPA